MLAHDVTTTLHHSPRKSPCLYNSLEFIYKKSRVGEVTHMAICNWDHSHPKFPSIQPQVPIEFVLKISQSLVLCLTKWIICKYIKFYVGTISTHMWALNHSRTLYVSTYIDAYVYQYIFIDLCGNTHICMCECECAYPCISALKYVAESLTDICPCMDAHWYIFYQWIVFPYGWGTCFLPSSSSCISIRVRIYSSHQHVNVHIYLGKHHSSFSFLLKNSES